MIVTTLHRKRVSRISTQRLPESMINTNTRILREEQSFSGQDFSQIWRAVANREKTKVSAKRKYKEMAEVPGARSLHKICSAKRWRSDPSFGLLVFNRPQEILNWRVRNWGLPIPSLSSHSPPSPASLKIARSFPTRLCSCCWLSWRAMTSLKGLVCLIPDNKFHAL